MHRYISNNVEILYNQTLLIFVHNLTFEEEQINWKILWAIVLIYVFMFTKMYCIMSRFYFRKYVTFQMSLGDFVSINDN